MHQLLVAARATVLHGPLLDALAGASPKAVAKELADLAPDAGRKVLAKAAIRDELVFMTPTVIRRRPSTFGYYRLLLGMPKKQFYTTATGMTMFRHMEEQDTIKDAVDHLLPSLCKRMNGYLSELVTQLSPEVCKIDIEQLPILTAGVQFDGRLRNDIGRAATQEVFLAIREIVAANVTADTATSLTITNASGRVIRIVNASDPDVAIYERFGAKSERLNVALEIKGGTDRSNAHNRAGEAEKSHQKVSKTARDFWTVIAMKGVDRRQLARESPTTKRWFDVAAVLGRAGPDWDRFVNEIKGAVGI